MSQLPNLKFRPAIEDPNAPEPRPAKYSATETERLGRMRRLQRKFQAAVLSSVSVNDIQQIMISLVLQAQKGNISAAREVLDRCVGKAAENELVSRIEELERLITSGEVKLQ